VSGLQALLLLGLARQVDLYLSELVMAMMLLVGL
jgi:hypothetical protein